MGRFLPWIAGFTVMMSGAVYGDESRVVWGDVTAPRGVVLLVHGLNNSPGVMEPLAAFVRSQGFASGIVPLSGHEAASPRPVDSPAVWLSDLAGAVREAERRYPGLPRFNISFSLGAAVTGAWLREVGHPPFERMVLLAPAFAPKGYTGLLRFFTWLRAFGVSLPSFVPREYRSSRFTPLAMYGALFDLIDVLSTQPPVDMMRAIPTLVVVPSGDEFISLNRLRRFIGDNRLTTWRFEIIPPAETGLPHHLMLDEPSCGAAGWRRLTEMIGSFLTAAG